MFYSSLEEIDQENTDIETPEKQRPSAFCIQVNVTFSGGKLWKSKQRLSVGNDAVNSQLSSFQAYSFVSTIRIDIH